MHPIPPTRPLAPAKRVLKMETEVTAKCLDKNEQGADGSEVPVSVASRLRDFPLGLKEVCSRSGS